MNARIGWVALVLALGSGAALAWTAARLSSVHDEAQDLKDRVRRLRTQLDALADAPAAKSPTFDWRALERRVERLESTRAEPVAVAKTSETQMAGSGAMPTLLPTQLFQEGPFRQGLEEMMKETQQKTWQERRAKWRQRFEQRIQKTIQTFAAAQNLDATKVAEMNQAVEDDRTGRREIAQRYRSEQIDASTASKLLEELDDKTEARMKATLGEQGYEAYEEHEAEQRHVWWNLRRAR